MSGMISKIKFLKSSGKETLKRIEFDDPIAINDLAKSLNKKKWARDLLQGDDYILGSGRDNKIWAGPGDDIIYGGGGDDNIMGSSGDDTIYGGSGTDFIDAGIGDDVIIGGTSSADSEDQQIAFGGWGKDMFVLSEGGHMKIFDFNVREDSINFAGIKGLYLDEEKGAVSVRNSSGRWHAWLMYVDNIDDVNIIK